MTRLKTRQRANHGFCKLDVKPRLKLVFLFYLICGFFHWTIAQSSIFNNFYLEQWDTDKGLPVDLILTMKQSKEGFLWLRTYNGLIRFDGTSYKILDSKNIPFLTSDNINSFIEAPDSTLWITSPFDGLWSYKNGKIKQALRDCNPASRLYWIKSTKEVLLSNSNPEIPYIRYNTQTHERINILPEQVDSLIMSLRISADIKSHKQTDSDGYHWWIWNNKIYRTKNGQLEEIEVRGNKGGQFFFDLLVDKQDRVWLPSSQGIFHYDGEFITPYQGMESAFSLPVASFRGQKWVMEDHDGGIWFVVFGNIAYLPPGRQQFEFPPKDHPLSTSLVTSMLEDQEGNIWFSSQSGLTRLSPNVFKTYSREEGLANQQVESAVPVNQDKYLISTINSGLAWNENGKITPFQFKQKAWNNFPISSFYMFKDSKNNIWACTRRGIYKITEDQEEWFARKTSVRFGFEDENGKLWFASSRRGIGSLNKKGELEFLQFDSIDFQSYSIGCIRQLSDGTWMVNSFNQGLLLIDPNGQPITLDDDKGLSQRGTFNSYQEEDGTLWIPSQSGLYRIKDKAVDLITHESGLPAVSIFDFVLDQNGFAWIPSNFGIIRVFKKELNDYLDGKIDQINWRIFDDGDGMRSRSCTGARHCSVMPDGRILVPTLDGIVEIDPDHLVKNELAPPVAIHQFLWNDQTIDLTEPISLSPGNSRFVFGYSGLSFKAPQKVQFKFRLKGYDENWIEASSDRRAIYTNLPFGQYTFQVIASNNDGVWNEVGDSISFIIQRPWWRSWLAYGVYGLIFFLSLIGVDQFQKKRMLKRQEALAKAKELEHAREIKKAYNELEVTHQNLKMTQAQLIQSEKMASLGELTAGIAHEIQNPLNFVNNFSKVSNELLEEMEEELEAGNEEDVKEVMGLLSQNLSKITHHGERASSIVKGMLQHSRTNSGVKEPTDINAICDEYLRLAFHGVRAKDRTFNADLKTDFDQSIENVNVVPQDFGRVILNLISNAFYAVNKRKQKEGNDFIPLVKVSTSKERNHIVIKIEDNGNGILKENLGKIFQPFFTTKPTGQGTGLGLSLSYDIIKAHGGELMAASKEGEGTTFTIQLKPS